MIPGPVLQRVLDRRARDKATGKRSEPVTGQPVDPNVIRSMFPHLKQRALSEGDWQGVIQVLFNLVHEGRLDEATGLDLADEFSQLGGDKYDDRGEVQKKWDSRRYKQDKHIGLTRLKEWAIEGGWKPETPRQLPRIMHEM
jgi:hypothetical protein